jgi:hypothetical protein
MRTKQVRPDKLEFEYELYVSKGHDDIQKKDFIEFEFRTIKVFENFAYKINVIPNITSNKKELAFNIEGLSAPHLDFSRSGPANFVFKFFDFQKSEYSLMISKYRKNKTMFRFEISDKGIKLTMDPEKKFIKVITEEKFVS